MQLNPPPGIGPGSRIGPYRLDALAGRGGMGVVYRATDEKLGRTVAVKFLARPEADAESRHRFRREALTASRLNHPHILAVYDAGEADGVDYLVTEFIDGSTLSEWIAQGPHPWRDVIELLTGIADALATAHEAGIIHRDVKPGNVLMAQGYAKLADFGLAKAHAAADGATRTVSGPQTAAGTVVGTIAYMSPEQLAGEIADPRSDVFAFGALLYEALEGRAAFAAATELETIARVREERPRLTQAVLPGAVIAIVDRALEKDPARRYQSMREVVADLRRVLRGDAAPPARVWRPRWIAAGAMTAVALALLGGLAWRQWGAPVVPTVRSVAVLPLRNLSGDPAQDYFSDGTTDQLISNLAQIGELKVISRTSVMAYKSTTRTVPEIAAALGVDAVIEGSVQREGNHVRINSHLIDAARDRTVWSADFDRELTDTLTLQADIARAIAAAIHLPLTPAERTRLQGRRIAPDALDAYLRGRALAWNFNDRDQAEAIRSFEEATRAQPDFAAAYAGITLGWLTRTTTGTLAPADAAGPARTAATRALELDPALAVAHLVMADVLATFDWNWKGAEAEYRHALDLDPNLPDSLNDYSYFLVGQGRVPEAMSAIDRAVAIDPLSSGIYLTRGVALLAGRRFPEAEQAFGRALELDPNNASARANLVVTKERAGDAAGALALLRQQLAASHGDITRSMTAGRLFAQLGRMAEARQVEQNVVAAGAPPSAGFAALELSLGDTARALSVLEAAVAAHRLAPQFRLDPAFAPVRDTPRFAAIVRAMGLPAD